MTEKLWEKREQLLDELSMLNYNSSLDFDELQYIKENILEELANVERVLFGSEA